ncbi:hypothetical protein KUCAC02_035956 [Chaenocephalus aceratus]|nr:hypothetical protein KUCAC02_035956 [Chaenocephalus aceratus]
MLSGCQSGCSSESETVLARFQVLLTRCTVPQVKGCSWQLQVPTKPPTGPRPRNPAAGCLRQINMSVCREESPAYTQRNHIGAFPKPPFLTSVVLSLSE